jgi:hypothetical protein
MVARLNRQLRNFIDDQARLENKRIMAILDRIEKGGAVVEQDLSQGGFYVSGDLENQTQFAYGPLAFPPLPYSSLFILLLKRLWRRTLIPPDSFSSMKSTERR